MTLPTLSGADAARTNSCGAIALLPALTPRCRVSTRSAAPDVPPRDLTVAAARPVPRSGAGGTPHPAVDSTAAAGTGGGR